VNGIRTMITAGLLTIAPLALIIAEAAPRVSHW
jgi:hypothetical protein